MNTALDIAPLAPASTDLIMMDDGMLNRMMRLAEIMASGKSTLPRHYRGSPGDCLAVIMQSMTWRMNPFAVAQKTYFVNDAIGYEGQLVNAVIESSGAIEGGFDYEWYGPWEKIIGKFEIRKGDKGEYRVPGWSLRDEEGLGIRISAIRSIDHSKKTLELLLAQCRTRNSTLWADDPKQQIGYLAVRRWGRLYTPGVMLGLQTLDEVEESGERFMGNAEVVSPEKEKPPPTSRAQALKDRVKKKPDDKSTAATLQQVLDAINQSATIDDLHEAARLALTLSNEPEKEQARKRYSERSNELREGITPPPNTQQKSSTAPPSTPQPPLETPSSQGPTAADVQAAINRREFDLAADLIRSFDPETAKPLQEALYAALATQGGAK